jgi:hypothetical protein
MEEPCVASGEASLKMPVTAGCCDGPEGPAGVTFATFVGLTISGLITPWPVCFATNLGGIGDAEDPPGDFHLGSIAEAGPAIGMNILCLAPTPGIVFGLVM